MFELGMAIMDDVYAVNVAKSNYREGFNTTDVVPKACVSSGIIAAGADLDAYSRK
jgi:hypothetical protein